MAVEAYCYGMRSRQADIGELTISYYWYANPGKPTLVLLHGFSADKSIWCAIGSVLAITQGSVDLKFASGFALGAGLALFLHWLAERASA